MDRAAQRRDEWRSASTAYLCANVVTLVTMVAARPPWVGVIAVYLIGLAIGFLGWSLLARRGPRPRPGSRPAVGSWSGSVLVAAWMGSAWLLWAAWPDWVPNLPSTAALEVRGSEADVLAQPVELALIAILAGSIAVVAFGLANIVEGRLEARRPLVEGEPLPDPPEVAAGKARRLAVSRIVIGIPWLIAAGALVAAVGPQAIADDPVLPVITVSAVLLIGVLTIWDGVRGLRALG